jgi:hypothetical protein
MAREHLIMKYKPIAVSAEVSLSDIDGMLQVKDATGHVFRIPLSLNGLRVLKAVLEAKELEPSSKIGSNAIPTQRMVDAFLHSRAVEDANTKKQQMEELKEMF